MRVSRAVVVLASGAVLAAGAASGAVAAPHGRSAGAAFRSFPLVDTRSGLGVGHAGRLHPGRPVSISLVGRPGLPASGTGSVRVRLTALEPAGAGALLGGDGSPVLRYRADRTSSTIALLPVTDGRVTITSTAASGLTATVVAAPAAALPRPSAGELALSESGAFAASATAAGARTATLAGSVLSTGRVALGGVVVSAFDGAPAFGDGLHDPKPVATATSTAAGSYLLSGLPAGLTHHLVLCFDGSHVAGSTSGYAPVCTSALRPLTAGRRATAVPAYLTPGVLVQGTVRDSGGQPVAGVPVRLRTDLAPPGPSGVTAADGSFSLPGGVDADTGVCTDGSAVDTTDVPYGYVPSCTTVPATGAGGTAAGLGLTVVPGGEVTGTVDGTGGTPLAGVAVSVVPSHAVTTVANGTYTLTGVPLGSQRICLLARGVTVGTGYLDDCATDGEGSTTGVPVSVSVTPARADDTLAAAAAVSGTVTSGGKPVAGARVSANPESVGYAQTYTSKGGRFSLVGLTPGSTSVCADGSEVGPTGYVSGCGRAVLVAGSTVADDPSVVLGGAVSGVVTDAGGAPLAGVFVYVSSSGGQTSAISDVTGRFSIGGLSTVDESLCTYAGQDGGTSPTGYLDGCSDVGTVTAGAVTTADPVLAAGGALTGRVLDATSGAPLGDASVELSGPGDQTSATTAADGTYEVVGLAAGSYATCAYGFGAVGSWPLGYLDGCPTTGRAVSVSPGSTASGADDSLPRAGGITGRLTDDHGNGIGGVQVQLGNEPTTAADGSFVVTGLPTGRYQVCFFTANATGPSSTGYADSCYGSDPGGTAVSVKAGHAAASVGTVVLPLGAELTGAVTSASGGAAVPGASISYLEGSTYLFATTDGNGRYTLLGVPAATDGEVCLQGDGVLTPAAPAGYLDVCASSVRTKAGTITTVSRALTPAGGISGIVTDAAGDPLANVTISPADQSGSQYLQATTDQDGSYQLSGLMPTSRRKTAQICYDGTYANSATTTGFGLTCVQDAVVGSRVTSEPTVVLPPQ